jgi:DNA-binding transcriptional MerR regulator
MRVAELAAAVGVGADTIRFYKKTGRLSAPAGTPAGYRIYQASVVDRLRLIQGPQHLGLKLRDIKNLLAVRDTGICPCEPVEESLRRRLAELEAEMARLTALREQMTRPRRPPPWVIEGPQWFSCLRLRRGLSVASRWR